MTARAQRRSERGVDSDADSKPEVSQCESSPGKSVFIETDNNDGWIASDLTVDVRR
ncbi:hypothetical protein [Natronomonas gomsonensis]|uniref:hypothetical protein n=1 Tax=Natronomonas gomsonensis TaxID=1046043 RepID=UPI0015BC1180|nr:hypothetical protein [Natronomonas gomsonensis]